jgi:hypothetical protein
MLFTNRPLRVHYSPFNFVVLVLSCCLVVCLLLFLISLFFLSSTFTLSSQRQVNVKLEILKFSYIFSFIQSLSFILINTPPPSLVHGVFPTLFFQPFLCFTHFSTLFFLHTLSTVSPFIGTFPIFRFIRPLLFHPSHISHYLFCNLFLGLMSSLPIRFLLFFRLPP